MPEHRACVVIPTYDNPATIRRVVERVRAHVADVIVVDDGSGDEAHRACARLARDGLAQVHHRRRNGGKGAAVKDGFALAAERGFTHVVQVDADGQHDLERIPAFLALSRAHPHSLVLGSPRYDETLNRGRYAARQVTRFWNYVQVLGPKIQDSMCGFRVYPLGAALQIGARADRMDFDIEIAVRMVWAGVPVLNEPVGVRYVPAEEGGVSHYHALRDTLRISRLHTRLCIEGCFRLLLWPARRLRA